MSMLERQLRKAGRELADYQIARFFKVPEELQQTPCDFFGYTRDGRAILVEAKSVNRSCLPIGKSPGLAPHQWAELWNANRANALALICWARGSRCAVLSMDMALEFSKERKSIPWNKIPERFIHEIDDHLSLLEPFLEVESE